MKNISKWFNKYFIPHRENGYRPHFLRHESILVIFLVVIVIELSFLAQVFVVFDKTKFLASVLPAILTDLTNTERSQNDAPPLTENVLLTKAAQMKAQDMAEKGYFAHTSPEGKTPWYWFEQAGYHFTSAGENLAVNFFESSDVATAWMNSPTHRANIVKKEYKEIGIGVASGIYKGRNTVFVAQLFGTPLATSAEPVNTTPVVPVVALKPVALLPAPVVTTTPTVAPAATQVLGETTTKSTESPSGINLFLAKILTSPRNYVNSIYIGILAILSFALLLLWFIKSEIRHPLIMIRGLSLISVIVVLFILNINLDTLHLKTNVTTTDITANAINFIQN